MKTLKIFKIKYDDSEFWVIATDMKKAISMWQKRLFAR